MFFFPNVKNMLIPSPFIVTQEKWEKENNNREYIISNNIFSFENNLFEKCGLNSKISINLVKLLKIVCVQYSANNIFTSSHIIDSLVQYIYQIIYQFLCRLNFHCHLQISTSSSLETIALVSLQYVPNHDQKSHNKRLTLHQPWVFPPLSVVNRNLEEAFYNYYILSQKLKKLVFVIKCIYILKSFFPFIFELFIKCSDEFTQIHLICSF